MYLPLAPVGHQTAENATLVTVLVSWCWLRWRECRGELWELFLTLWREFLLGVAAWKRLPRGSLCGRSNITQVGHLSPNL